MTAKKLLKRIPALLLAAVICATLFTSCDNKTDTPDPGYNYATADPEEPFNYGKVE